MRRVSIIALLCVSAIAVVVIADEGKQLIANKSKAIAEGALSAPAGSNRNVQHVIDNLNGAVDSWHLATLHEDKSRLSSSWSSIQQVIVDDLKETQQEVRNLAYTIAFYAAESAEYSSGQEWSEAHEESLDNSAQIAFQEKFSSLKSKRLISAAINASSAFSNKYRLLGDYVDLLRRELGMKRIAYASVRKESMEYQKSK
ncbi:MAG: hypothetical protein SGI97_05280 [candidate division Zixibacteria bacterium]|nr:hypothetical protein [candidate division Zixibacteria bacterium]